MDAAWPRDDWVTDTSALVTAPSSSSSWTSLSDPYVTPSSARIRFKLEVGYSSECFVLCRNIRSSILRNSKSCAFCGFSPRRFWASKGLSSYGVRGETWRGSAPALQVQRSRSLVHGEICVSTILAFLCQFLPHVDAVSSQLNLPWIPHFTRFVEGMWALSDANEFCFRWLCRWKLFSPNGVRVSQPQTSNS